MTATKILTDSKDKFLIKLHDQIMTETNQRKKLLLQLIRDVGMRWREILDDGVETAQEKNHFFQDFILASQGNINWVLIHLLSDYIKEESVDEAIDQFYRECKEKTVSAWKEFRTIKNDVEVDGIDKVAEKLTPKPSTSPKPVKAFSTLSEWANYHPDETS